jgi:L-asparagine transporter-like permease
LNHAAAVEIALLQFACEEIESLTEAQRYWFKYIITTPNQLTAAALVIQYWCPRDKVNPGVFIAIFLVTILVVVRLVFTLFLLYLPPYPNYYVELLRD